VRKKCGEERENMLFNFVEKYLMRPRRLREAIQAVVRDNDEILRSLKEYEDQGPNNLTWSEGDLWYGWTHSPDKKRYYFDDIGYESIIKLWEKQWEREAEDDL
jgi:hypothetical protein